MSYRILGRVKKKGQNTGKDAGEKNQKGQRREGGE